jgi:hypothetical protein
MPRKTPSKAKSAKPAKTPRKAASERPPADLTPPSTIIVQPQVHHHYNGPTLVAFIKNANLFNLSVSILKITAASLIVGLFGPSTPTPTSPIKACLPAAMANTWTTQMCVFDYSAHMKSAAADGPKTPANRSQ